MKQILGFYWKYLFITIGKGILIVAASSLLMLILYGVHHDYLDKLVSWEGTCTANTLTQSDWQTVVSGGCPNGTSFRTRADNVIYAAGSGLPKPVYCIVYATGRVTCTVVAHRKTS